MPGSRIIAGETAEGERLFAAVDPGARYVEGKVCTCRLGAQLAPYADEGSARVALAAAGAKPEGAGR